MGYILIAEDERDILLLMQRKLEMSGYTIWSTGNGNEALEKAISDPPMLAILDIMLPGRDGLSICTEIKAALNNEAPPVLITSARGQSDDLMNGQMAGADSYLIKPFSPRELLQHVQALLDE